MEHVRSIRLNERQPVKKHFGFRSVTLHTSARFTPLGLSLSKGHMELRLYVPPPERQLTLFKPTQDIRDVQLFDDIQSLIEGPGSSFDKTKDIMALVHEWLEEQKPRT